VAELRVRVNGNYSLIIKPVPELLPVSISAGHTNAAMTKPLTDGIQR
jgi:hypothetical protein